MQPVVVAAPACAHLGHAVEDDVVDPALAKRCGDGEAGWSGPDDGRVTFLHRAESYKLTFCATERHLASRCHRPRAVVRCAQLGRAFSSAKAVQALADGRLELPRQTQHEERRGGNTWHKAPLSGSATRRALASSRPMRAAKTCSSTTAASKPT